MISLPDHVIRTHDIGRDLGGIVGDVGLDAIIVTEAQLAARGLVLDVEQALASEVLTVPGGEPTSETVEGLARALAHRGVDTVVAVGGGSVIDIVKLAARLVTEPDGLESRLLSASAFPDGGLSVVAVPTTAGSGAEVTRTAIVNHKGRKTWAWDEELAPQRAVLAAELCLGSPSEITVAAGLDAFVHAVEAVTGQRNDPELSPMALLAASVIVGALPAVTRAPFDREARAAMLEAASAAGCAIDRCGTGVGHAVGHALASLVTIPHGLAVMLGSRAALEWSIEGAPESFESLAHALSPGMTVRGLPGRIDSFLEEVGFDELLRSRDRPSVAALAEEMSAPAHLPMCRNNARPVTTHDRVDVARMTLERWPR